MRGILGTTSTVVVLALFQEPTVKFFLAKLILFSALSAICIVTAKSKQGVLLGRAIAYGLQPWIYWAADRTAGVFCGNFLQEISELGLNRMALPVPWTAKFLICNCPVLLGIIAIILVRVVIGVLFGINRAPH